MTDSLKYNLRRPCKSCPFRKKHGTALRRWRREEIADALRGDRAFICHNTVEEVTGGENKQRNFCAGALIAMKGSGILGDSFSTRIAMRFPDVSGFDPDKLATGEAYFDTLEEWVEEPSIMD